MEENNKKTEYLKSKGIRTMQKDLAKLREIGFQKTKERLTGFKPEEKAKESPRLHVDVGTTPPTPPVPSPPSPLTPLAVTREIEEQRRIAEEIEKREEEAKRKKEEEEKRKREEEEIKRRIEEGRKKREEEERKRRIEEEIRKREEEEKRKRDRIEEKKKTLNEKKLQLEEKLALIPEKKKPIEEEKSQLLFEIEKIKKGKLAPILIREKEIKKEKKLIEEEEKKAPFQKKVEIEEKRWQIEEERGEIEKEKWLIEEEIIKIQEELKEKDLGIETLEKEAEKLKELYENVINEEEAINLLKRKINLEKEFKLTEDQRLTFEVKLEALIKKKSETERVLNEILESEKALEEEVEILEEKEELTVDLKERREIEQKRMEVEKKRRETEKEKWQIVKKQEEDRLEIEKIQFEVEKSKKRRQELEKKIEEIDTSLKNLKEKGIKIEDLISLVAEAAPYLSGSTETSEDESSLNNKKKRISEEIKVPEKEIETPKEIERKIEEAKKRIEETKKEIPVMSSHQPPFPPTTLPVPPKKPTPFPAPLSPPPPLSREIPRIPKIKEFRQEIEIPKTFLSESKILQAKIPEKPKPYLKILIRGIIVVLFLLLLGSFIYWFFWVRKSVTEEPPIPPVEETGEKPVEKVVEEPKIVIPAALISVEVSETLEISALEEIPQMLSSILEKKFAENQFTRILIKDVKENKILGLKDFFEAFEIKSPKDFYEKLDNNFTLFVYSSQGINHLGFVAKIVKKENLANLLNSWEKTMKKDLEKLLLVLGKKGPASTSGFKSTSHRGVSFRYLSLPQRNFGICWALTEDLFIFTSSGQSMMKTIDKIQIQTTEEKKQEVVDCGEINLTAPKPDPQTQAKKDCIEQNFKNCKPAKFTTSMLLMDQPVTYYYEIIGPDNEFCTVKSKYLKNPNPNWIDKEMICKYDNKKEFDVAAQDMSRCKGPLYDLMRGL